MPFVLRMTKGLSVSRLPKEDFVAILRVDLEKVIADGWYAQEQADEARKKYENAQSLADSYSSTEKDLRDQYFYLTGEEYNEWE